MSSEKKNTRPQTNDWLKTTCKAHSLRSRSPEISLGNTQSAKMSRYTHGFNSGTLIIITSLETSFFLFYTENRHKNGETRWMHCFCHSSLRYGLPLDVFFYVRLKPDFPCCTFTSPVTRTHNNNIWMRTSTRPRIWVQFFYVLSQKCWTDCR